MFKETNMAKYKDYKIRLFQTNEDEDKSKELQLKLRDAIITSETNVNSVKLIERVPDVVEELYRLPNAEG